jgi:SAM-dependent methyltransferase
MLTPGFADVGACWVCGGTALARIHEALLDLELYRDEDPPLAAYTGQNVWLVRCAACGFTQPERLPVLPDFFDRLYAQRWAPEWIAQEFESDYKDLIFQTVLDGLARRAPPGGRLLDIGTHAGRFLHLAHGAGWQPEGVELNARTAAFAQARTGWPVHRVNIDRLTFAGKRYGVVTLIDVLEHIPDPVVLLTRIREALSPGGWVAVKVPSGPAQRLKESVRARLRAGYRPRLADNLVHVNHFSPGSLRLALETAGFREVSIEIGAPELPAARGALDVLSNLIRRSLYRSGCLIPGGVHTPLALNLQAYARRPS